MSTLCRAEQRWQEYGGAETSERPFFCQIHFSAFLKRVNGCRRISDNRKYFGNISDLFFFRRIAPPGLPRRCPEGFGGEGGSGSVKPGQTDSAGQADGQIVCKGFNMNDLRNKQRLGGSNSVKVDQTSSGEGSPAEIRPFFASFALGDFAFNSDTENQTKSHHVAVSRSDLQNGKFEV
jgi:hypothetical protein